MDIVRGDDWRNARSPVTGAILGLPVIQSSSHPDRSHVNHWLLASVCRVDQTLSDATIDVYEADRKYWESLWHQPAHKPASLAAPGHTPLSTSSPQR